MSTLPHDATATETAAWLESSLPESFAAQCASAARTQGLTASALLALSEDEAENALGLQKFGQKRKLTLMLQGAKDAQK